MKSFPRSWTPGWTALNVFIPSTRPNDAERYLEIADKFHLLVTGGSDCHGFSKGKPLIGTVKLPYEHVEKLKSNGRRESKVEAANAKRSGRNRFASANPRNRSWD
jgi:hypothetical protein